MLDEKFQMAYNLTYNTMATHKDVDTSMLRRAIWNYIHCMFGIRSVAGYPESRGSVFFLLRDITFVLLLCSLGFIPLLTLCFFACSGMMTMITGR